MKSRLRLSMAGAVAARSRLCESTGAAELARGTSHRRLTAEQPMR